MKKLLLIVLVFSSIQSHAIEDDKVFHFGVSFVVTSIVFGIMSQPACIDNDDGTTMTCGKPLPLSTRLIVAATVGLAFGLVKEGMDARPGGTGFDWNDMAANGLGVGTSLLVFSW